MVLVGALIGGITNSIAIKMLFRPYKAIYVKRWRVPFTPGLIPKRRVELAEQLGKLVTTHLLTAEGLKKKLESSLFMTEMTEWLKKEVKKVLRSDETITSVSEKWFGITDGKKQLESKIDEWLEIKSVELLTELRPKRVKDVIPENLNKKVEQSIPQVTAVFIEKGKHYFETEEGIERLSNMVDRFLSGRGTVGNMVSMFLGNERLVDKIQPEIIKMLNDEGTHELIEVFMKKEWEKLKQSKVEDVEEYVDLQQMVYFLKQEVMENVPVHYFDEPFHRWTQQYEQHLLNDLTPRFVKKVGQTISDELVYLLKKLKLEEVVKHQVEQFSVKRLEDMVLSISRKEFKLITYLGAILGGLIGLFQGIILIFLQ
ncbi:hypothetical protein BKP35_11380 [Anaerobacillus arseniciselenatis]|uniref:DUF445 domain-containing protein n=2 Tax=Anaerobacillus arseniciselenatis TaxID=85682 RepID=A0A1S2LKA6_9BACI|nr:hypothetical protein BKP35_11380 [Anaerobacillus arseniciselenatis]